MTTILGDAREEASASHTARPNVSWKAVAFPGEHGGWGMLGEPLLLGLVLSPSWAGLGIAVAAVGAFLARHPLKLILADRRRGARYARTAAARRCLALYGIVTLMGVAVAGSRAPLLAWLPLVLAAPLGLLQLRYDVRLQSRRLAPEILGGTALAGTAPALMLAGGWPTATAFAAWFLLAGKTSTSVLYVRARLRLDRGQRPELGPPLMGHGAAILGSLVLTLAGHAPWLAVAAFAGLLARAAHGLSGLRRPVKPQILGIHELAFGVAVTALFALGYWLGL